MSISSSGSNVEQIPPHATDKGKQNLPLAKLTNRERQRLRQLESDNHQLVLRLKSKDAIVDNLLTEIDRVVKEVGSSNDPAATVPITKQWRQDTRAFRRKIQFGAKVVWWTVTLRLRKKLKKLEAKSRQRAARGPMFGSGISLPSMTEAAAFTPTAPTAAVVHVHHPELWQELSSALRSIPDKFDLFVSVTQGAAEAAMHQILSDYPQATVVVFPNHGRDLLPFFTFAKSGILTKYKYLCKIHTKRSLHRSDGDAWRHSLINGILGGPEGVKRITDSFDADPDLGIVVADGQIFGARREHWVDNERRVLDLGARIGLEEIEPGTVFAGGSMFWIRPFLLRTLNRLDLTVGDFEIEPVSRDAATAHALERLVGIVCADAGMRIAQTKDLGNVPARIQPKNLKIFAYYLPQYHPTPENDRWWGKGFTEWANVTRATALFAHHKQPRLPADLGFYDLRLPQVRKDQEKLAKNFGVDGFCYYYYWFDGRGMLREPLDAMLAAQDNPFPFALCWANEPWTRNWDGGKRELLVPQTYQEGWIAQFAQDILPYLSDSRYLHVNGVPMLLIYRVMHIRNIAASIASLRDELKKLGVPKVHISAGWVGFEGDVDVSQANDIGIDSWFEFPPHRIVATEVTSSVSGLSAKFTGKVYSYRSAVRLSIEQLQQKNFDKTFPAVMAGWDNTARRLHQSHVFHGATPALFRKWLRAIVLSYNLRQTLEDRDKIVFINAWNEWAEGTYLEPDTHFGSGWLEAVASAVGHNQSLSEESDEAVPAEIVEDEAPAADVHQAAVTIAEVAEAEMAPADGKHGQLPAAVNPDQQWLDMMIRSAESQQIDGVPMAGFPAENWQKQFVGSSNAHAMREAANFQKLMKHELAALGRSFSPEMTVLDFGCGWGRYIRLWMKDLPPERLFGVDVDPDMIGFCRVSGLPATFATVPSFGPTGFDDESFDLIYAYSVFSHLSEDAHVTWMEEFTRILKPGGVLIFTTQAKRFLTWTSQLHQADKSTLSSWEQSLSRAFPDIEGSLRDYDAGKFIFAPTGGGDHRPSTFYGEAAISEQWLRERWDQTPLTLKAFIDDPVRCPQAVAVMQRDF